MEAINTVLFDLDDTLRINSPHAHDFFCDYLASIGKPVPEETRRQAHHWEHRYWANSPDLLNDMETFNMADDSFWENYSRLHLTALGFSDAEAIELASLTQSNMREHYRPESVLRPDAVDTLKRLKAGGYALGVLTNRSRTIYEEMARLELDADLDVYLSGGQLEAYKPDREIFDKLLGFIGRSAEEVLYVGDNYYADILGARNAGLPHVLLDWKGMYQGVDCPTIRELSELPEFLAVAAV